MGAADFFDEGYGATAKEAFAEVVEEARYEYGHGGYTGSIAEKSNFVMVTFDPGAMIAHGVENGEERTPLEAITREMFAQWLGDNCDHKLYQDKWGPAGCFEVESDQEGLRKFIFFGSAPS